MATGDIIKQKREDMGITQDDLALSLGVAQSYISAIEANRKIPNLPFAKQIAKFFGCKVDDLC